MGGDHEWLGFWLDIAALPLLLGVVWLALLFWLERIPRWFFVVAIDGWLAFLVLAVVRAALTSGSPPDGKTFGDGFFWFLVANVVTGAVGLIVLTVATRVVESVFPVARAASRRPGD